MTGPSCRQALTPFFLAALLITGAQLAATAAHREFYLTQLILCAYYACVVLGLTFLVGYAGQISLAHGAFFAIGGYATAVLTTTPLRNSTEPWVAWLERAHWLARRPGLYGGEILTVSPWAAFLAGLLVACLAAVLIGLPALRLRGHYLAMATLGFGLIVYRLLLGSAFAGAADGITGVPPLRLGGWLEISGRASVRVRNYYFAWGFALLTLALLRNLLVSRIGLALRAIHDNESAAQAMGVPIGRVKLQAFVLSAAIAAAAGSLLTHTNGGLGPSEASAMKSVRYVALVAAGGMASLWGALAVSSILNFFSLRGWFGTLDHAVFGALLIAIVAFAPGGFGFIWRGVGLQRRLFRPRKKRLDDDPRNP